MASGTATGTMQNKVEALEGEVQKLTKQLVEQKVLEAKMDKIEKALEKKEKVDAMRPKTKGTTMSNLAQFCVKLVSPKLNDFDKPVLLAAIGFGVTSVICAILMWFLLESTTSEGGKTGTRADLLRYFGSKTDAGIGLCVKDASFWGISQSASSGFEQLKVHACMPVETWDWCEGMRESHVLKCGDACPPCDQSAYDGEVFTLSFDETTYPSVLLAIGALISFYHKTELLVTFFFALVLLKLGVVKQYNSKNEKIGFDASLKKDQDWTMDLQGSG